MAEIAVGLATKQAEGLIDKLQATISGELSLLLGVREEIRFIKDEMKIMSAFLRRAEEKQYKDPVAKAWVEQVKELAYVIEDCIDEFSLHLPCRSSNINLVAALWHRARSLGSLRARRRIAVNIQSIKLGVKEVSERRWRYGIDEKATSVDMNVVAQYDPRSSAVFVNKSQLIGIDEPLNKLVKWLLDKNKPGLRLIGVVGGAGLGKTTIVKRAYEDQEVAGGYFQCRAWITVSQVYHIEGILRSMIKQLIPDQKDEDLNKVTKRVELVQKLRDYLKDKRYAIVFDDIWQIDAWRSLEDSILQENEHGSRIIITTRNREVAEECKFHIPGDIHEQEKLNEENSWKLFCERLFPRQQTCPEEFKKLSQDILQKCDGSPLAIVAIAATLASKPKKTSKEWESFSKHLSSEFESNPNLQGVMKILNYSYIDLPYHVQRCFLYLSRFPEDSMINCNRIKKLWMAEGLISTRRDMSAEEVTESYLNMLINRSMILPSKISARGVVRCFTIHDVMMEMIVSISVEENFVSRIQKDRSWHSQGVIRRLLVDSGRIPDDLSLSYVRSLILFGDSMPSSLFVSPAFKLLRALDLDDCQCLDNNHLAGVSQIPTSLTNLTKLTLRETELGADAIEALGTLPTLIQLVLSWRAYKGGRLCFKAESFKSLKLLVLCGMQLGSLVFEIGAMPCLERAVFIEVGQISGVENLIGLKMIKLYHYGGREREVDSVSQAAKAHPNDPKLIISEGFPISSSVWIT